MAKYNVGMRIETTIRPVKSGTIIRFQSVTGGLEYYVVHLDGEQQSQYLSEDEVRPLTTAQDPWERLMNGSILNHEEFGVTSTFFKVGNHANNTISSLQASRTIFQPYQFKPLIKFLRSVSKRILIADEVGLGKTIEAGHILLEMYSRKEISNALVICPKSLLEKWEDELFEKFGFDFKVYNTKEFIQDLKRDIQLNKKSIYGIITYDRLKNPKIQEQLNENNYSFDLIISDEAHFIRNADTSRYKKITPIIIAAKYVAMLTATPICNRKEDLFNILRVLEPQRYLNYSMYINDLETNKPFVKALNMLNRGESFKSIIDELKRGEILTTYFYGDEEKLVTELTDQVFKNDPLYQRVIDRLEASNKTPAAKVEIQNDLIELNSLNHILTRAKKRDVKENRVVRKPHDEFVSFSSKESELYYRELEHIRSKYDSDRDAIFTLINTARQISSSLPAFYARIEDLDNGIYRNDFEDSKFDKLKKIIEKVVLENDNKLIIFAYFKKTLRYLNLRIQNELGVGCNFMDGGTEERSEMIHRFKNDPEFKVLISGSIGAEGLDMQFCDAIVNYDLPWNPMKIEQRIGRIDRFGQKSEKVHIYNLVIRNTIEEIIYKRLLKKIKIFEESLGDLEAILLDEEKLGKEVYKLESELYSQELTDVEKKRRVESTTEAMINERKNLELIETELQDSMINDVYFQNEVERIKNNKRYITDEELLLYLRVLIRQAIPACNLIDSENKLFTITTPSNDPNCIFTFIEDKITKNQDRNGDATNKIYYDFKRKFFGKREILITFDQDLAFNQKKLEFINSYHPLVVAASNFFNDVGLSINNAYSFSLSNKNLDTDLRVKSGNYILALNSIQIHKEFNGEKSVFTYLHPIIVNPNSGSLSFLKDQQSEHIFGIASILAEPFELEIDFTDSRYHEFIKAVQPEVMKRLIEKEKEMKDNEIIKLNSLKERIKKQTVNYYDYQIGVREERLKKGNVIKNIMLADIQKLEDEKDSKLNILENTSVRTTITPVSVSHIFIN